MASSSPEASLSGSAWEEITFPLESQTISPRNYPINATVEYGDCFHYSGIVNSDGCSEPRRCSHCLHKEGCMINQFGKCVRRVYSSTMDFRMAQKDGLVFPRPSSTNTTSEQRWFFPVFSAAYCQGSDPVYQHCRQNSYWLNNYNKSDTRYRIGQDGCICISACDSPAWHDKIGTKCYYQDAGTQKNGSSSLLNVTFGFIIAMPLLFGIVCAFRARHHDRRISQRRRQARENRERSRVTALLGSSLNFLWWNQHRQEFIKKEHSVVEETGTIFLQDRDPMTYVAVEDASSDVVLMDVERQRQQENVSRA